VKIWTFILWASFVFIVSWIIISANKQAKKLPKKEKRRGIY